MSGANVDTAEIGKFDALAGRWWDPAGPFRPLHELNPLRLGYIQKFALLDGMRVLDVGCGGGILTESLARAGANVLGIDLAQEALAVAELHAIETHCTARYRVIEVAALAAEQPAFYDVITCMEMLEHVPDPSQIVASLAILLKPKGRLFVSTINRNPKAFVQAILSAEYLLGLVPRGTHEYAKFIRPSELARWGRAAGLEFADLAGMGYNPLTRSFRLTTNVDVNYLGFMRRVQTS
jgi:2-polyprenyl-6-hydroxyphenyl methylase / 3-demethylubiquinone-9 3-methyltransferase